MPTAPAVGEICTLPCWCERGGKDAGSRAWRLCVVGRALGSRQPAAIGAETHGFGTH
jgi:hypothetical protein